MLLGKCKLTQQTRYSYTTVRIAKPGTLITPDAGKDVRQQEPSLIVGENA